jgi:hypothetical protein
MNIASGEIAEFQAFDIQLKVPEIDNTTLMFIQKSVPYPVIFILRGGKGKKAVAIINTANKPLALSTEWKSEISLNLKGSTTDVIYKNYLLQLSSNFAAVGGDAEKHAAAIKLKRSIDALLVKMKNETQISKRQDLARERHALELELKELLR